MSQTQMDLGSVHPELREKIAAYIGQTDEIITEQQAAIAGLQQKLAATCCEACGESGGACTCNTNKNASLEMSNVEATVAKIIQAGFLKEGNRQQALQAIGEDPAGSLLDFIDKLATQRIELSNAGSTMPKLGHAVPTGQESVSAPQSRESDRSFEQCFDNLSVPQA